MNSSRILVVEDEAIIAADLSSRLQKMGHTVGPSVPSGEMALAAVAAAKPDLVLMDITLRGEMNGIEAAERLRELHDVPVVYLTSHADAATIQRACGSNPFGYVLKPFNERELQAAIQIALYRHQTESKLRKMERWLTTTLSSIGDGVIATDKHGAVTLINPVAERLTGWQESEALGRHFEEVFRVLDSRTRQPTLGLIDKALQQGFSIGFEEHVCLQAKGGAEIPIDDSISPIRDDAGQVSGVVLVFRDCTERKLAEEAMHSLHQQLEHRVRERTAQLESANRALAGFSYSVSHDLRAPLRAVHGYTSLLAENYAHVLDEEGNRFLLLIKQSCGRLGQMIDDYLRLFRLRQESLRLQRVDMSELVKDVLADPALSSPSAVEVGQLPDVQGDAGLLRQVWVNLLANAIKYTAQREQPQIQVGVRDEGDRWLFYVKDNGAGFDMRGVDKLFRPYQRLHSTDEFEGTGIGLAIVNSIIERHGGQVRAEGEVGMGAIFYFTLPRQEAADLLVEDAGSSGAVIAGLHPGSAISRALES